MKIRRLTLNVLIAIFALSALVPSAAQAEYTWGSTSHWPWSGYWYPVPQGSMNMYTPGGPLDQYDKYVKATRNYDPGARQYELKNKFTTDQTYGWWGHCHAWASASMLVAEPSPTTKAGVQFNNNNAKGLVTKLYDDPTYHMLSGIRVDDPNDRSSNAYKDIAPAWMDYLLRYYIGYYQYPFVMDLEADSEVWNYPVFAFTRDTQARNDGSEAVTTTIWYATPDSGVRGTNYASRTYTYTLKAGTLGEWTGGSVHNHPDFAWVPTGRNNRPHVDAGIVGEILDQRV